MQNGQIFGRYILPRAANHEPLPSAAHSHAATSSPHAAMAIDTSIAASDRATCSPTNHRRSQSQSQFQSYPHSYAHESIPISASPGVNGLPPTRMQAPPHVSTFHQYQEQLQRQQQLHLMRVHDPHVQQCLIAHAQLAPIPPLPSSHPETRPLVPAPFHTNPQQQQHQPAQQHQKMAHTQTTATTLIPATALPVRASPSNTEQSLRAQPPALPPPLGATMPLAMQIAAATRLRDQVQAPPPGSAQTHTRQTTAITNPDSSAGAGAGTCTINSASSPPGTGPQTRPSRALQNQSARSPVTVRTQAPPPPSNSAPSQQSSQQQQPQQHYQRYAVPPALAAFKVLQPAKELLEQTWATAIAAVQEEYAVLHGDLARLSHDKQALHDFLQRMQTERMQLLHALHTTQNELKQCTSRTLYCPIG